MPTGSYDGGQSRWLHHGRFAQEDEDALFHSYLWRLNIGAEHQGNVGYGRLTQFVEALRQEAMRRGQHRLTVCY